MDFSALGRNSLRRMTDDAKELHAIAASGAVTIDPDGAVGIANTYDQMVDEIYWIKIGMLMAGQHPKLGSSPYAEHIAKYQHQAAEAFLDAVTELESACESCASAFREAARHYVERDDAVAGEIKQAERRV